MLIADLLCEGSGKNLDTEQSGMEVLSGCFGLFALLLGSISAVIVGVSHRRSKVPERQRLNTLLIEFCTGTDQSLAKVNQIRSLLMVTFTEDSEHEELAAAANSFAPGGLPPFHDEAWLEDTFLVFLGKQGIVVPAYGREKPGVWPPPPRLHP